MRELKGIQLRTILIVIVLATTIIIKDCKAEEEFEKITIQINALKWSYDESASIQYNTSAISMLAGFQISNPNEHEINLLMGSITIFYRLNLTYSLEDKGIKIKQYNGFLHQYAFTNLTIKPGITNDMTYTSLTFNKTNIRTLPEGEYTLWIYLYFYGEKYLNSIRSKIIINDGVTTIHYSPTINLANQKMNIICPIVSIAIIIRFLRYKKRIDN